MSIEADIERSLVDYIKPQLPDVSVEVYSGDLLAMFQRAKTHSTGCIFITQSSRAAEYDPVKENNLSYDVTEYYLITVLINSTKRREVLNEYLSRIRDLLVLYKFSDEYSAIIERHYIYPTRMPDPVEGVHMAEIEAKLNFIIDL